MKNPCLVKNYKTQSSKLPNIIAFAQTLIIEWICVVLGSCKKREQDYQTLLQRLFGNGLKVRSLLHRLLQNDLFLHPLRPRILPLTDSCHRHSPSNQVSIQSIGNFMILSIIFCFKYLKFSKTLPFLRLSLHSNL